METSFGDLKYFGDKLDYILKLRGIKQYVLAEKVGVTKGTISNIVRNLHVPETKTVLRICDVLGLDFNEMTKDDSAFQINDQVAMDRYTALKHELANAGVIQEGDELTDNQIELFKRIITDNKELFQSVEKALLSKSKKLVIDFQDTKNN